MRGWGRETRTTESVRTEIRLSCGENFCPIWPNGCSETFPAWAARSRLFSCGRAFGRSCPPDGPNLHQVLKGLTRAGRRTRTAEQAKKIIRAVASFRSTSALDRAMHVANAHRALRLAPLPLGLRGASAVAAQLARRAARAKDSMLCSMSIAAFSVGFMSSIPGDEAAVWGAVLELKTRAARLRSGATTISGRTFDGARLCYAPPSV